MIPVNPAIAGQVATLLIEAATWVYQKMNEPQPLRDAENGDKRYIDKTRYERLCRLRTEHTQKQKLPDEWELNEQNCPIYESTFGENAKRLTTQLESLDQSTYPQKLRVGSMVARIEHLFSILHSKKATMGGKIKEKAKEVLCQYEGYRSDGFEAMFFSDLALWLSIELPRYPIHQTQTAEMVKGWIRYCEEVDKTVLIFRGDKNEANNPKHILQHIILGLKRLHVDICKACKAASFNVKIESIDSAILVMNKSVFDLFYLVLDDATEHAIQVESLIEQHNNNLQKNTKRQDHDIQKILKYLMGQWIIQTLEKAGIECSGFENKKPIDPASNHLHLNEDFSQLPIEKTGLWKFAQHNISTGKKDATSKRRAENYLKQIIEIHRALLMLYYVRSAIVLGSEVSKELGDAWVYGEDTGRAIITILCQVILDSCSKLHHHVQTFWQGFYREDYDQYTREYDKDDTDPCFRSLAKADNVVEKIHDVFTLIAQQLIEIEVSIKSDKRDKKIPDKVRTLNQNLVIYANITGLPLDSELKQAINYSEQPRKTPIMERSKRYLSSESGLVEQNLLIIEYDEQALPYYMRVKDILDDGVEISEALMQEPQRFLSDIQKNIYQEYLVPNETVASLGFFRYFSFFHNIYPNKIDDFIATYARIHAIMRLLYVRSERQRILGHQEDPTPVERVLIDILLNEKIRLDFQRNRYYRFNALLASPPFKIDKFGTKIQLKFTGEWFNIIKDDLFRNYIQMLMAELEETKRQNEILMQERDQLRIDLAAKEVIIQEKDKVLQNKENEIEQKAKENEDLTQKLTIKANQLPDMEKKIEHCEQTTQDFIRQTAHAFSMKSEDIEGRESIATSRESSYQSFNSSNDPNEHTGRRSRFSFVSAFLPNSIFSDRSSSVLKMPLILITVPSGNIETRRLGDSPFLIQQDGEYHLYGQKADGLWGLTALDARVVQPLGLLFPKIGEERTVAYKTPDGKKKHELRSLYVHIAEKKAHIPEAPMLMAHSV
jgi:hypothetical protein